MKKILICLLLHFSFLWSQHGYFYVKSFQTELQHETNRIGCFQITDNGLLFSANSYGIIVLDGKTWHQIPIETPVYDLELLDDHIFFLTEHYIGKIDIHKIPFQPEKFLEIKYSFHQMERVDKKLFLYSDEQILVVNLENATSKKLSFPEEVQLHGMLKFKNEIWILTSSEGLFSVHPNTLEIKPVENSQGLENQFIQNYFEDSSALYIVTVDNVIYAYENSKLRLLGQYSSSKNTYIYGIVVIENDLIAATNDQGLLVINKKNGSIQQQINTIHGLPDNESHAIYLDKNRGIWLAHPFQFSRTYWSKSFEDYTNAVGLIGNIHCMAQVNEQIWVGTDNGLFYLSYEIPKESEMVSFTLTKTIVKRLETPKEKNTGQNLKTSSKDNPKQQDNPPKNEEITEKKGFFKKLKDKFSKKNKKDKKEDKQENTEQTEVTEESKFTESPTIQDVKETRITLQENYNQIAIKNAENYRRYLVFHSVQGISEMVYDIYPHGNTVYVGTHKGFYEVVNYKVQQKLPILCNKIIEYQGNIWITSHQKIIKLQKNKNWEASQTLNTGRYINTLILRNNELIGGTSKGYFITSLSLQAPKWFLENEGRITVHLLNSKVYALSSKHIYLIEKEPILQKNQLPAVFHWIPTKQGLFLVSKSLILSYNSSNTWDTLYYSRLLDDLPSYILETSQHFIISGKKSLIKVLKQNVAQNAKVYVRGYRVTGKSFWGTVFKDSLITTQDLNLGYGDYNIQVQFACSYDLDPDAVQYFVSINHGEWSLIETKDWILYNLPAGNYSINIQAVFPNGNRTEILNFQVHIGLPFWRTWWFYLLVTGLVIGSAVWYTRYKLRKLEEEKRKVEEENKILEQKVQERTREIAEQKKIIEEKNNEIMDSLRYSERIQQAMLPKEQAFQSIFDNNCFVLYMPRDVVSGDFYWLHEKNNQLLVAAGDCTGHGVPGALMSMIGISMLNKIVDNGIKEPSKILSALHKEIHEALKQGSESKVLDGMDIAIVLFEPHLKKATFASAMRPIYFFRDNDLTIYKGDKKPIGGKEPERFFSTHELFLEDGDIFYLFSDGYADQFNPQNQKYQLGRFRKLLQEIHQKPLKEQQEILKKEILEWKADTEQVDDIMVIGIKYKAQMC